MKKTLILICEADLARRRASTFPLGIEAQWELTQKRQIKAKAVDEKVIQAVTEQKLQKDKASAAKGNKKPINILATNTEVSRARMPLGRGLLHFRVKRLEPDN